MIAFVGNGFDIQAMHDYGSLVNTCYESFYHFLKLRSFDNKNLIFTEIENLPQLGKENWSDIEGVVGDLVNANREIASNLHADLLDL
ncbi:bacteriophage abortive infection AbiH family protein [Rathayibacter toxicus]|uniref:bacteriophage abortive infection AbiH family protein n=1 Tax=Rathayibacter toxicus TaxID=145458 RepID=UPI001C04CE87|nr:bacteriophage abortive infection AbiH family protein [Rathayibacter toxicus]